jgi:hypothetical protein
MEKLKLSNQFTVYRAKYTGTYSKEAFISKIAKNKSIIVKKTNGGIDEKRFILECDEFKSVDKFTISTLEGIEQRKIEKVAKFSWIYTQTREETMIDMHKHDFLHYYTEKTKLETDWTCVFYIQIPEGLGKEDGNIVFMTEDKKLHSFIPQENDLLIFSGKLGHMITPIPNAQAERVVYASNFNFNLNID